MESTVAQALLPWYDAHGRKLPFRGTKDPYRVWVSEIMLQQTRTETVGAYYTRFLARFPDVFALAAAPEQDVLKCWEGLGYYSRARNLHKTAKEIASRFQGVFPADYDALRALSGVGDYTAAAVASIAFGLPCPAMDGNLTRVLSRVHGVREDVGAPSVRRRLLALGNQDMPSTRCGDFNQALMDLGASLCCPGTPDCDNAAQPCPLRALCDAYRAGDADALPVKTASRPPVTVDMAVAIVTSEGKTLMTRRRERLLEGLWVYPMLENASDPAQIADGLRAMGVTPDYLVPLGEAKHVFTHRIWQMHLWHCHAQSPTARQGEFVRLDAMRSLPIPTAMRAARAHAEALLSAEYSLCPLSPLPGADVEEMQRAAARREALLPLVAAAYCESWRAAHRAHCSAAFLAQHTPEHMAMLLRGQMELGQCVLALRLRDEIIGVMTLDFTRNEICTLYVRPAYQSRGAGQFAVRFALARLDARRDMRVTALCDNAAAMHLYRKMGFSQTGEMHVLNAKYGVREAVLLRPAGD